MHLRRARRLASNKVLAEMGRKHPKGTFETLCQAIAQQLPALNRAGGLAARVQEPSERLFSHVYEA